MKKGITGLKKISLFKMMREKLKTAFQKLTNKKLC